MPDALSEICAMTTSLDHHLCFCGRRAGSFAVGKPDKLLWYCDDCGVDVAKEVLEMKQKEFDVYEKRAAANVAKSLGNEPITLSPEEMTQFVSWAVEQFAINVRNQIISGNDVPF